MAPSGVIVAWRQKRALKVAREPQHQIGARLAGIGDGLRRCLHWLLISATILPPSSFTLSSCSGACGLSAKGPFADKAGRVGDADWADAAVARPHAATTFE
jgi:hypothetical protein